MYDVIHIIPLSSHPLLYNYTQNMYMS